MDIKKPSLTYTDMRSLAEHAASCFPDRAFFLCADERLPSVSGAELYGYCKKAAAVLDAIPVGRHIALLGPGSAAWLAAYFAVLSAGRMIVPLHDGMQQQELEDCLRLADCGLLLYDERRGETASALARAIPGLRLLELHAFIEKLREENNHGRPLSSGDQPQLCPRPCVARMEDREDPALAADRLRQESLQGLRRIKKRLTKRSPCGINISI